MISAWHLVWIIPLSGIIGFVLAALMSVSKNEDTITLYTSDDAKHEHLNTEGKKE